MNKLFLREKFRENPSLLHDSELLNIIGVKVSTKESDNVTQFLDMSEAELIAEGFNEKEAATIRGIKELATRYLSERMKDRDVLASPQRVVEFLRMKIGGLPHEAFAVVFLNAQNEVISHTVINEGTIDQVAVYPRRIIEKALAAHAAAIIISHNHPSGHTDPSDEDKNLTRTLNNASKILDIRLLDHIIVGKTGYFSFVERGLL